MADVVHKWAIFRTEISRELPDTAKQQTVQVTVLSKTLETISRPLLSTIFQQLVQKLQGASKKLSKIVKIVILGAFLLGNFLKLSFELSILQFGIHKR